MVAALQRVWMGSLETAHGLRFDPTTILDAFKIRQSVVVGRSGVRLRGKSFFSSPALVGLYGQTIEVRYDPTESPTSVESYLGGEFLDTLRSWDTDSELASDVAHARLDRMRELKRFRKDLRKILKKVPAIIVPATVLDEPTTLEERRKTKEADSSSPPKIPKLHFEE